MPVLVNPNIEKNYFTSFGLRNKMTDVIAAVTGMIRMIPIPLPITWKTSEPKTLAFIMVAKE